MKDEKRDEGREETGYGYHVQCGHFHVRESGCPESGKPCGNYECCVN